MANALALGVVLCALLHAGSAGVLPIALPVESGEAVALRQLSHLQPEIEMWKKLGLPTVAQFEHVQDGTSDGYLIALPESASLYSTNYVEDTHFHLFTRENRQGSQVEPNAAAFKKAGWEATRPTKVVIHGFANDIESAIFTNLVPALLDNSDVNVIGVDWGKLAASPWYTTARYNVEGVGKEVAKLVDSLVQDGGLDLSTLHVMGHSLGAHVSGNVGKNVKSGTIARITGMDPAMPLFLTKTNDRLTKDDAQLVDVVHTCGGFLGLEEAIGHVDFYPNGGSWPQTGCGWDLFGTCSHGRSYLYFKESAIEENAFPAGECPSPSSASNGKCSKQQDGNMGLNIRFNPDGTGAYYLKTAGSAPFDPTFHSRSS